jgi:hypothetical protein
MKRSLAKLTTHANELSLKTPTEQTHQNVTMVSVPLFNHIQEMLTEDQETGIQTPQIAEEWRTARDLPPR